jgi:hypothetical protein
MPGRIVRRGGGTGFGIGRDFERGGAAGEGLMTLFMRARGCGLGRLDRGAEGRGRTRGRGFGRGLGFGRFRPRGAREVEALLGRGRITRLGTLCCPLTRAFRETFAREAGFERTRLTLERVLDRFAFAFAFAFAMRPHPFGSSLNPPAPRPAAPGRSLAPRGRGRQGDGGLRRGQEPQAQESGVWIQEHGGLHQDMQEACQRGAGKEGWDG